MAATPSIYRYSNIDTEGTHGMYPSYGVEYRHGYTDDFCDQVLVDLPAGYEVVKCEDRKNRLQDPQGRVCDLVTNNDHGFWIMPVTGGDWGLYVHVDGPTLGDGMAHEYTGTIGR